MYYNTNEEDGPGLRESWARTAKQNDLILMIFQDNPNETFTPDQIQHLCEACEKEWPITSIRRAISTLTKAGNLTKTVSYGKVNMENKLIHGNTDQKYVQILMTRILLDKGIIDFKWNNCMGSGELYFRVGYYNKFFLEDGLENSEQKTSI